jgi:hypothetical protein
VNEVLAERFVEQLERLVLGIEPIDALRASRIAHPIDLVLDRVPFSPEALSWEGIAGMPDPIGTLGAIPRHNSCRHALIFKPGIKSPIAIRMYDRFRRFVPAADQLSDPFGHSSAVAAVACTPASVVSRCGLRGERKRYGVARTSYLESIPGQRASRAMGSGGSLDWGAGCGSGPWRRPRRISPHS